ARGNASASEERILPGGRVNRAAHRPRARRPRHRPHAAAGATNRDFRFRVPNSRFQIQIPKSPEDPHSRTTDPRSHVTDASSLIFIIMSGIWNPESGILTTPPEDLIDRLGLARVRRHGNPELEVVPEAGRRRGLGCRGAVTAGGRRLG